MRQYNSERWARQQRQRVARRQHKQRRARGNRQRCQATAWVSGRVARGKEEPKRRPGCMPVISTRARSYRSGPAEAHSTKWWNLRTAPYLMQGQQYSRHQGQTPEQHPRLPRLWVCATHKHIECATCAAVGRGFGTAAPGGTSGIPTPLRRSAIDRPGRRVEQGRRSCAHRGGGG